MYYISTAFAKRVKRNKMTPLISNRLNQIQKQIEQAAQLSHRDAKEIRLLAVSKTQSFDSIKTLYDLGIKNFAENRVQEALPKIMEAQQTDIIWHFIGTIQSNKTKQIAEHFSWVQSLSDHRHAERLNDQRPAHLPPINICLQFNVSQEANKSGVKELEALIKLAEYVTHLPRLRLRGLMALPLQTEDTHLQREQFARMDEIFVMMQARGFPLDVLSMGMSNDFSIAIQEGATMIRIGSALFSKRQ